jgi:prenyltransferase beta subunit
MLNRTTGRRTAGLAIALAVGGSLLLAPGASATTSDPTTNGLFGSQDATFDGVYRQSLSLIALEAADARVPAASVRWLKRQQCANGSFMSYRTELGTRCGATDSNATALATIAFKRLGERSEARAAVSWLIDNQHRSGGWEYTPGWGPDANSTGLVVQALIAMNIDPADVERRKDGLQFLASLQLDCDSESVADRGALDYQRQSPLAANDFATAQATAALAGSSLPVRPNAADTEWPTFTCDDTPQPSAADAAAGYLGRTIDDNGGAIPGWDAAPDYTSTANAVLSLVAAGHASNQIDEAIDVLELNAEDYTTDDADALLPAADATLALVAIATGGDPRSFGSVNPIRDILDSRTAG